MLNQMRLSLGMMAVSGIMRPMIDKLADYFINTRIQNVFYKDLEVMKEHIGSLVSHCYALESMIYLTAGLKDIYQDQDIDVECAMIKAYAVQVLSQFITTPLFTVGQLTTSKDEGYEKLMRDAIQLIGTEEPIETLKQFIALSGLSHAGKELNEQVLKQRSILDHPMFIFSRLKNEISIDSPKLKMELWQSLHPSLRPAGDFLETSIYRLRAAIEILLPRYGPQIYTKSGECGRISDIATLCFAMFAASARASRSYCIGLRNADQEIYMTNAFNFDICERIRKMAKDIDNGEYGTTKHTFQVVGEKLIEHKKYHMEHPTTRNF
jgi:hypothetical protein